MPANSVLVTGSTGNVGTELIAALLARDVGVVAAVTPGKEERFEGMTGVKAVPFDFAEKDTFEAALDGVTKVFLLRPPQMADPSAFEPFLRELRHRRVAQTVFLSLMGAQNNPVAPHRKIEKLLLSHDLPSTFLRPSFYMQNLSTTHLADIRERNRIFVPAGNGKTSLIDVRDIAESAAVVLTEEGHIGNHYTLTGPEAISYYECAGILTRVLCRTITYAKPSSRRFVQEMRAQGHPKEFVDVMRLIYLVARLGLAGKVTPDLRRLLRRPPTRFERFVRHHAEVFEPAGVRD